MGDYPMTASKQTLRGIIKHMSQLKDTHRVILIVQKRTEEIENENNAVIGSTVTDKLISVLENLHPKVNDVKEAYKLKYKVSQTKANSAYSDAVKERYLKEIPKKFGTVSVPHFVTVITKGRTLVSRDFGIPTGRFNMWLKEHSAIANFISGGLVVGVVAFILWIVKKVFFGG